MDDFSNAVEYRAVSKTAVAGALIGALSLVSLLSPPLILIPMVGVIVSVGGLLISRRSELAGAGVAAAGLALSLFCLCSVLLYTTGFEWMLKRHARLNAQSYLELLGEDRVHEAHQLMAAEEERQAEGADLDDYYRFRSEEEVMAEAGEEQVHVNPREDLERAFSTSPLKEVAAALQEGDRAVFVRTAEVSYGEYHQLVHCVFRLDKAGREFVVGMRRYRNIKTKESSWQVSSVMNRLDKDPKPEPL